MLQFVDIHATQHRVPKAARPYDAGPYDAAVCLARASTTAAGAVELAAHGPVPGFAAFASAEAKNTWGDTGDLEPADGQAGITEFDFRAGGQQRFGFNMAGMTYRYDARYYDIVPDQRIIYAYQMYASDARISVSVATIEFAEITSIPAIFFQKL